jgi:hypothetical protein
LLDDRRIRIQPLTGSGSRRPKNIRIRIHNIGIFMSVFPKSYKFLTLTIVRENQVVLGRKKSISEGREGETSVFDQNIDTCG